MLEVGDAFPKFSLPNQDGRIVSNKDLLGKVAVFYFYPKDDTSGCTTEACEFRDRLTDIPGAAVYGVSPDGVKSHKKFAEKYGLNFTLLADEEKTLCQAVGVWVEKSMYGNKHMGVERTSFILTPDGLIYKVFKKVKPAGHAAEIIAALP